LYYQFKRYCPVLVALEGSALWSNTYATALLHDQNRTIPFGLIVQSLGVRVIEVQLYFIHFVVHWKAYRTVIYFSIFFVQRLHEELRRAKEESAALKTSAEQNETLARSLETTVTGLRASLATEKEKAAEYERASNKDAARIRDLDRQVCFQIPSDND